jgi:hypothetical protein
MSEWPNCQQVVWPKDSWRLRVRFSVSSLRLRHAIQYGIFCEDPLERFPPDLSRVANVYQAKLSEVNDPEKKKALRRIQLAAAWNNLFRALRGDQVYLLIPDCSDIALMSNAPAGKKWLVTKPVQVNGRSVCWSVPFEAVTGEEVEINLTEANLLDLASLDKVPSGNSTKLLGTLLILTATALTIAMIGCQTPQVTSTQTPPADAIQQPSPFLDRGRYSEHLGLCVDDCLRNHGFIRPWIVVTGSDQTVWFVAERLKSEQRFDRVYVGVPPGDKVTASITPYQFYASDWAILGKLLVGGVYRIEAESIAREIMQRLNDNAK